MSDRVWLVVRGGVAWDGEDTYRLFASEDAAKASVEVERWFPEVYAQSGAWLGVLKTGGYSVWVHPMEVEA